MIRACKMRLGTHARIKTVLLRCRNSPGRVRSVVFAARLCYNSGDKPKPGMIADATQPQARDAGEPGLSGHPGDPALFPYAGVRAAVSVAAVCFVKRGPEAFDGRDE